MRSNQAVSLTVGLALLVSAQTVVASESANATQADRIRERPVSLLPPQPKVRRDPYGRLFEAPVLTPTTPVRGLSAPLPGTGQPRVVCGMTLIPIDPSVDPKIYVEPRRSDTRFTIRAIPPPVCR